MVLTAYFVLSPVIGLSCHRRLRIKVLTRPGRARKTSANLTPASRRQDHTTSPSASAPFVCAHRDRSRGNPPCDLILRAGAAASTASRPASVTIAIRPCEGRDGKRYRFDLGQRRRGIFLQMGWTGGIRLIRLNKFSCARKRHSPAARVARSPPLQGSF
jgi:hypothetical protein